ncbi:MAG TPA: hypothetical protein GX736_02935 [Mogibacterium sp.]|nr:hypothetical protein [Mogibacterium sp.]
MNILQNRVLANIERGIGGILILAMILISIAVYRVNVAALALFFLFIAFYVQIPGLLIVKTGSIKSGHESSQLLISFFAGWILIIAEYFMSELINSDFLLYFIGPVMSVIYFIKYSKEFSFRDKLHKLGKLPLGTVIFAALTMLYVMLYTQFMFLNPEIVDFINVSKDKLYQMGLINGLAKGFPLANPWIAGRYVYYHIFSQILYSIPVRIFKQDSWFMIMSCAPYLTTYLLSLSFYSMLRYFSRFKHRAGVYSLSVFLSHMFIARSAVASYIYRVVVVNDNFAAFGVAAAIAWVIVLDIFVKKLNFNRDKLISSEKDSLIWDIILLLGIMALMTGIKAPIALIMLGAIIGTQLLAIILKRANHRMSFIAVALLGAFYLVYKTIITSGTTSGSRNGTIFVFGKMTNICFWKKPLIEFLQGIGVPSQVRLLVILFFFYMFFFTIYALPVAVGYIRELFLVVSKKKEFDFAGVTVYAALLVGFVMMMFLSYSGHSQVYFGIVSVAFAPIVAFRFFEDVELDSERKWMKSLAKALKVIFIIILCFTTLSLAVRISRQTKIAIARSNPHASYNPYNSVSAYEYEGLKWIKENTPEDSLLATEKHSNSSPKYYSYENRWVNCHFHYAVYSNRSFYIEGAGFSLADENWMIRKEMIETSNKLFDVSNDKRGDLARSLGIDYVVVSESVGKISSLENEDYKLVYSNPEMEIYQIK